MSALATYDPVLRDGLQKLIEDFLAERQQAKLKVAGEDPEKQATIRAHHQREVWLAEAARRARWIQLASHTIKQANPDARGSSIYLTNEFCSDHSLVGTHLLGQERIDDVVAETAAGLSVYSFLKLEFGGATLLQRMLANEPAATAALSDNLQLAESWVGAFTGIVRGAQQHSTHFLAKQLYFPVGIDSYHLVAPLFPTSLVQRIYGEVEEDREHMFAMFKASRKTEREVTKTDATKLRPYRDFPNLAIQKFGGANPQNISQLNTQRRGICYLLPSLPPHWQSDPVRPPLRRRSVLEARGPFASRRSVRELTDKLKQFLQKVGDRNNVQIRNRRAELVDLIVDELLEFAAGLHTLPAGWSAQAHCDLDAVERRWLDPFAAHPALPDWTAQVAHRFGNWLNSALRTDQTPMADEEHREWKGLMRAALHELEEVLSDES